MTLPQGIPVSTASQFQQDEPAEAFARLHHDHLSSSCHFRHLPTKRLHVTFSNTETYACQCKKLGERLLRRTRGKMLVR